jgi:predicted AlkP superfamily pyrophosphatase or phosphodiesterase
MTKVVLIMIDGLRPDALRMGHSPHVDDLLQRGSYSLTAQSVMPSITLPCHMSIFHSVPPARHGITTNIWTPMARPLPGLIEQIAGTHTAFFHSWEPLRNLNTPETLNFSYFYHRNHELDMDRNVLAAAIPYIQNEGPDFAFVYFSAVDIAGHDFGWMSEGYLRTVSEVDQLAGELIKSLPADYSTILQSDHGGHDRYHGTDLPEDMTVPWVIVGSGIRQGYNIQAPISILDTAPTITRLLGFAPHPEWDIFIQES